MKKFEVVLDEPCRPALVEIGKEEQLDCVQKQEESDNKETKIQRLNNTLRKVLSARTDVTKVTEWLILIVGRIFSVFSSICCFSLIYAGKSYVSVKSVEYIINFFGFTCVQCYATLQMGGNAAWNDKHGLHWSGTISVLWYRDEAVTHFISNLLTYCLQQFVTSVLLVQ